MEIENILLYYILKYYYYICNPYNSKLLGLVQRHLLAFNPT